jgi:hypothetical protein
MAPNITTIRNLPFFDDKTIVSIEPVSADPIVLNAVVCTTERPYFVKVRNPQRDRYHRVGVRGEFEAIRAVGAAGIGPQAFYCDEEQHAIVMEHLAGTAYDPPGITSAANLPRAARAIRALHALPLCGASYDIEQVIENYLAALDGHPLLLPEQAAGARAVLARCRKSAGAQRIAMCHGDLAAHNIFECDGIKFIDLEMAGANDIHFDLATFFMFNGLNADQERDFLREYLNVDVHVGVDVDVDVDVNVGVDAAAVVDFGRLSDARYAVGARDALWALSEMASGKINEAYPRIAAYHFQLIAAMA